MKFSLCCRSNICKTFLIKYKANLLILLWTYTAFLSISTLGFERAIIFNNYEILVLIFVPLGGWLGDVCLGRYKVIKYSMRLLWVCVLPCNILLTVYKHHLILTTALYVTAGIGAVAGVGIFSNSLQFSMDQLVDASSSEISSFIRWLIWMLFLCNSIFLLSTTCFCGVYNSDAIPFFQLPLLCTISVISDFFFHPWLIKEPVKQNPVKLIYQVLKYAAKNKHPHLRSAFTYWEDKPYSRIDLGKSKYGGPFTTEQVEDVKTFFRILAVSLLSTPLMCLIVLLYLPLFNKFYLQFEQLASCKHSSSALDYMTQCYNTVLVNFSSMFLVAVFFPFAEIVIWPLLKKISILSHIKIFHKLLFGMSMFVIHLASILSVKIIATRTSSDHNATCLLNIHGNLAEEELLNLNMYWLILPQIFSAISTFIMISEVITFIMAQAPYSMRGFLFGSLFAIFGISIVISNFCLMFIAKITEKYATTSSEASNCSIWYFGVLLLLSVLVLCGACLVMKWYTPRRRDEDLHNRQKFAIEYFEKYISYNN